MTNLRRLWRRLRRVRTVACRACGHEFRTFTAYPDSFTPTRNAP